MNGSPVTSASNDITPMAMSPLTKAKSARTTVESCRFTSEVSRARRASPKTIAAMSPPIGPGCRGCSLVPGSVMAPGGCAPARCARAPSTPGSLAVARSSFARCARSWHPGVPPRRSLCCVAPRRVVVAPLLRRPWPGRGRSVVIRSLCSLMAPGGYVARCARAHRRPAPWRSLGRHSLAVLAHGTRGLRPRSLCSPARCALSSQVPVERDRAGGEQRPRRPAVTQARPHRRRAGRRRRR